MVLAAIQSSQGAHERGCCSSHGGHEDGQVGRRATAGGGSHAALHDGDTDSGGRSYRSADDPMRDVDLAGSRRVWREGGYHFLEKGGQRGSEELRGQGGGRREGATPRAGTGRFANERRGGREGGSVLGGGRWGAGDALRSANDSAHHPSSNPRLGSWLILSPARMGSVDDLKDFGLAVLSLLVASVQAQGAESAVDPAVAELAALAAALPTCGLVQSCDVDRSASPAASLVLDGSYGGPGTDDLAVDGGAVVATSSSSKSATLDAAKALDRTGGHWQSASDARSSWFQLQLERPTFVLFAEFEWKWAAQVRAVESSPTSPLLCDQRRRRSPCTLAAPRRPTDVHGVVERRRQVMDAGS